MNQNNGDFFVMLTTQKVRGVGCKAICFTLVDNEEDTEHTLLDSL